jgi:PBP1b-binding outer membrane lipoprotein LpoB
MKKIKLYLFFILTSLILNSCGSVQNAMDPQRKNNTDEFLVEKKSPLSMPPDFEKLPIPKSEKVVENEIEENNLKKLIVNNQTSSSEISSDSEESVGSFEKSLIEKIKNN